MKNNLKSNILEFITNMTLIGSFTYWLNSILMKGFQVEPVSVLVGLMIILVFLFLRNLNVDGIDKISFRMFREDEAPSVYIIYIGVMIMLDLIFLFMNLIP